MFLATMVKKKKIDPDDNHQWILTPFGESCWGALYLDGINIPPVDYILFTKRKLFLSRWRKLTVITTPWRSDVVSSVVDRTDAMCVLTWRLRTHRTCAVPVQSACSESDHKEEGRQMQNRGTLQTNWRVVFRSIGIMKDQKGRGVVPD